MGGAAERHCALVAGFGVLEGEGASGRFCGRLGLGRMRRLGDVFACCVLAWVGERCCLPGYVGIAVDGWVDDLGMMLSTSSSS